MLIYEYRIRDEFDRLKSYAQRIREGFENKRAFQDLLVDADNIESLHDSLNEILPKEVKGKSEFKRHIAWMKNYLREDDLDRCIGDIISICDHDIPNLEREFRDWCRRGEHYDEELAEKISDLVVRQEYDSAVRKAFVILKTRLASKFSLSEKIDGPDLVNKIFGKASHSLLTLSKSERLAMRDLLAGMYGVFRNKYAHSDYESSWYEADAIVSMVNYILKEIESFCSKE